MNYPSVSDYMTSLLDPEHNLPELSNLRPVLDKSSKPIMFWGNFSVVFKVKDGEGNYYAIKCFLRDIPNRQENYHLIADELEYVSSSFLTSVRYVDDGITVNSTIAAEGVYPILLMEWVEGVTLHSYIRMHLTDKNALAILPYQFGRLAAWLLSQPFAHGDLKPDNILVKPDGTLCLVDYDAMFVSAMKGQESAELSSADFRHPLRTAQKFDEHIDDFSLASMALALKAISLEPLLYQHENTTDGLLFSSRDYCNIGESGVFQQLAPLLSNPELAALYGLFFIAYAKQELSSVSHRIFLLEKPSVAKKNSITPIRKMSASRDLTFTVNGVSFDMIFVEGGSFQMGTPQQTEGIADDEKPAHEVTLDSYAIGKYAVTQSLWQAIMGKNPSSNKGENHPVEMISWYSCQLFIEKLNALTGKKFSLPTEAQWEFAARGGMKSKGFKFAGSNNLDEVAWHMGNSGNHTHAVGEKQPNELGLYDMSGNVWEWCSDYFGEYEVSAQLNPTGPEDGEGRVLRGGRYWSAAGNCRPSFRFCGNPDGRSYNDGFRLALSY